MGTRPIRSTRISSQCSKCVTMQLDIPDYQRKARKSTNIRVHEDQRRRSKCTRDDQIFQDRKLRKTQRSQEINSSPEKKITQMDTGSRRAYSRTMPRNIMAFPKSKDHQHSRHQQKEGGKKWT